MVKEKPKITRCKYKNNECERLDVNDSTLVNMCEGSLYFKCPEYIRLIKQKPKTKVTVAEYNSRFDCY